MKTLKVIVMSVIILAFSLTVLLIVAYNSGVLLPNGTSNRSTPITSVTNTPSPNDVYQVKIANFSSRNGWFCPGGVAMTVDFDVTIQNSGAQNVTNLTLLIKRTGVSNDNETLRSIQTLNVTSGGTVHTYDFVGTDVRQYCKEFYNSTFTATISLNGVVLDEKTIEITQRQF
ncbi:MAG: hypothetical protein M1540_02315 [Candidatus Bathyarchaeota archaeon]|nr:hypothetical protein [Candidatus Bathyarchaeota archaeon]